ncbi:hypothetical protein RCS94_06690 [Orbaceae bacterium ac157xtp]
MADIADNASEYEQMVIAHALNNRVHDKIVLYKYCRNCQELTPDGLAFCDSDCRDDFEKRNK